MLLGITVEDNLVGARNIDTDPVISEALSMMEVEDEHRAGPLKDNNLVTLVLERDVCLRGMQPAILGFGQVHGTVKVVEVLVPEETVLSQVELATSIPERVAVALAREVEPLRMTEFVTLKVEPAFTSKTVGEETDHLVKRHTPVNNMSKGCEVGHVGVELGIAEMHHEGLVTDKSINELATNCEVR